MFRLGAILILILGVFVQFSNAQDITFEANENEPNEFKLKTQDEIAKCLIEHADPRDEKLTGEIFDALLAEKPKRYKKKLKDLYRSAAHIGIEHCGFTKEYVNSKAFAEAVSVYSLSFATFSKN